MLSNIFNKLKKINVTVLGLILITIFFVSYNYFTAQNKNNPSLADRIKNELTKKGAVTDEAAKDDRRAEIANEEAPTVAGAASERWVATDYKQGDVNKGEYVVKKGDTLWEIAEAVYGDGTQWHKILDANKSSIGFLPNGSQALITTGQTLYLP